MIELAEKNSTQRRKSWNANHFPIPVSLLHTVDLSTVAFVIPSRIRSRLPRFFPARSPTLRLKQIAALPPRPTHPVSPVAPLPMLARADAVIDKL
jgi:hypothetical protein